MELEALLLQIGELEQGNRKQEQKILEETLRHKNTAADLEKANQQIEQLKVKILQLEEKVNRDDVQMGADAKNIEQLKVVAKNYQQEIGLLQDHLEKEKQRCQVKTDEFLETIDNVNAELRKIHSYYQEKALAKELEAVKGNLQEAQDELARLQANDYPREIAALKIQLAEAQKNAETHRGDSQPMMVDAQVNQQIHLLKAELEASKKKNQEFELEMEKMNTGFHKDAALLILEKEQLEASVMTYQANEKEWAKFADSLCPTCMPQAKALFGSEPAAEAV